MKVTIIRHGFPEKRASGQDDLDRSLVEMGKGLIPKLDNFDVVFSSPACRCVETARLASGGREPIIINALSTHKWNRQIDEHEGWELIEKCYYLPSGEMAELPLSLGWKNLSALEQRAWELITTDALEEIMQRTQNAKSILIASHQFHVQAIALRFLGKDSSLFGFVQNMYFAPGSSISFEFSNIETKCQEPQYSNRNRYRFLKPRF